MKQKFIAISYDDDQVPTNCPEGILFDLYEHLVDHFDDRGITALIVEAESVEGLVDALTSVQLGTAQKSG